MAENSWPVSGDAATFPSSTLGRHRQAGRLRQKADHDIQQAFAPARMDARREQTDVDSFEVLEPVDYLVPQLHEPRPGSFSSTADREDSMA
jgi:hypothetical protein